jgi:hypothetical protein
MNIDSYRSRLEEYEERLNRRLYQFYSGRSPSLDLVGLYSDYSDIISFDSIHEVESESQNTSASFDSRRKSLNKMRDFLKDQHLDAALAPLTEEILNSENQRKVLWEGRDLNFAQIPHHLKNESDAFKRRNLNERYARELQKSEGLRLESVARLHSSAVQLGFKNYVDAREQLDHVEYHKLLASLDAALQPLEDKYMEHFRLSFECLHSFQEAGSWDISYWEKNNEAEPVFSKGKLHATVQATISELGVQPGREDAISIDLENREGKRSSPLCIPIRIPDEIKILMIPGSGAGQYFSLFHEMGHACHFAWTSPSLPLEHRIMGDRALSESYAFLLESFPRDREWLSRMFSFVKSWDFLRFQALFRLFLVRLCVGKLRFAINLYGRENLDGMPENYSETMKSYTGLMHPQEFWLYDLSNGFYSADHLRGWMCEAMLREHLRTKYGNSWIVSRSAAGFLKEIWETGQLYSADELCKEIGMGELTPQVFIDEITEGLKY